MNSLDLTQLVTRTAAKYRTTLSELEMDAYLDDLTSMGEETLRAALAKCAEQNPRYFPTVAEIRAAAVSERSAEDREQAERRKFWRSWLPHGICPHHWDAPRLAEASAALGLPEPSPAATARCEENHRAYMKRQEANR
jgi:hypothetical protein